MVRGEHVFTRTTVTEIVEEETRQLQMRIDKLILGDTKDWDFYGLIFNYFPLWYVTVINPLALAKALGSTLAASRPI